MITENAVCLFVSDTAYETRYTVAYFTPGSNGEILKINLGHFYGPKPVKRDVTIMFDGKSTKQFINLLAKDKQGFLKELQKRFSGFAAQDKLIDFADQAGIPYAVEDTLEINDQGLRHEFDDVCESEPQLYDVHGNFIIPKLYNPPQNGVVKIYTKDNFLRYEFPYKNGKMHGLAKCYFENRKVLSWKQTYTEGKLDGTTYRFFRKGTINNTETFVKGVKEGPACQYSPDGYLEEEVMWAKNQQNGSAKRFYANGQVRHEASFVNNLQEGPTRMYYESGKLKYEGTYKKGKCYGVGVGYYESGKKKYVTPYKNGKIDGLDIYYYKNGKVEWETPYKRDVEEGKVRQYHENGNLKQEATFKKGKKEGISQGFYKDGTPRYVTYYKDDKKHGLDKTYYPNGKLRHQTTHKNDKINGKYTRYYTNGKKCYEYNYKDGIREGYSTVYDQKTGAIKSRALFKKGLLVDPYGYEGILGVTKEEKENKNEEK